MRTIGIPLLTEDQIKELVREYSETDIPILYLSKKYKISRSGITYQLKKHGVYNKDRYVFKGDLFTLEIISLYQQGLNASEIARKIGFSPSQIGKILTKNKVEKRKYAPKIRKARKIFDEQGVIDTFLETKSVKMVKAKYGYSLSSINRILNRHNLNGLFTQQKIDFIDGQKETVIELYNKGVPLSEIKIITNIFSTTLERRLKKWGIIRNREGRFQKASEKIPEFDIIAKFYEFRTMTRVAEFYKVRVKNIRKILIKNKIDIINFFREDEKTEIISMYKKGILLNEIGEKFNTDRHNIITYLKLWGVPLEKSKRILMISKRGITEEDVIRKFDEMDSCVLNTAKYFNTTCSTVRKILKKHNRVSWSQKVTNYIISKKDWVIEQYRIGICGNEIADVLGVGRDGIYNYLQKWGVELRPSHGYNTSLERKMSEILSSLNLNYKTQFVKQLSHKHNDRVVYDFYLNDFNLIIEVNGDYWHGNPQKFNKLNDIQRKSIQRDVFKRDTAIKDGYSILYFWEFEVHTRRKDIELILKNLPAMPFQSGPMDFLTDKFLAKTAI